MVQEERSILARKIPPQIAEAVAGMELLGAELVDRKAIIEAIDSVRGQSFSDRLATELSKKIGQNALEGLTKNFESAAATAATAVFKNSQALAGSVVEKHALANLTKNFESAGMNAMLEATKSSQQMLDRLAGLNVMKTFKFESKVLDRVIRQMSDTGWLVPTKTRGMWEFSPGSQVGSIGSSNLFLPLLAVLTKRPALDIAVTMESAAFIHQLSEHPPRKGVIAVPPGTSRKGSLAVYRHVNLQLPTKATIQIDGVPVYSISGLLAAMAIRPLSYRDWPNVKNWLSKACATLVDQTRSQKEDPARRLELLDLLKGQSVSTYARAAYFFRFAGQTEAANQILEQIDSELEGPIYLGPRDTSRTRTRYDSSTKVYDSLIDYK